MRRPSSRGLLLALLVAAGAAGVAAEEAPKAGEITERIACRDAPDKSYALYLPPGYSNDRAWPVLYVLDPRQRGLDAVRVFRAAAERFGWIVVGSYDTLSDAPDAHERNIAAMGAMWRDTHARLSIDPRRVYAAGMSGGARAATFLADSAPGTIAGVIACAAGFSPMRPPHAGLSFAVFGTVGNTDFNYGEMQRLDRTLRDLDLAYRIVEFDGEHGWPPQAVATEAVEWLEVRAMRQGRRERNQALVDELYDSATQRAHALEEADRVIEAAHAWRDAAEGFAELRDVTDAEAAWGRARAAKSYARAVEQRQKLLEREREAEEKARESFVGVRREEAGAAFGRLLRKLDVERLRKRAEDDDREERLSARRILASLFSQLSFYVPAALKQQGDYPRALLAVRLAAEVRPESPRPWLGRAAIEALADDPEEALESLARAVDLLHAALQPYPVDQRNETLAFWRQLVADDEELASLHERPEFDALLDRIAPS